jgi:uncharacterized protein YndB with AHSA1/START domain
MEKTVESTAVVRELEIDASPETVWEFLTDPQKATRWMGTRATLDAQPGGLYYCEVIPGHIAKGEYVEVDKPHRLVHTWGWEQSTSEGAVKPGTTTIEYELIANGDATILRFKHQLPSAEAASSHSTGWDHYFERLAVAARGDDPGEDPWLRGEM